MAEENQAAGIDVTRDRFVVLPTTGEMYDMTNEYDVARVARDGEEAVRWLRTVVRWAEQKMIEKAQALGARRFEVPRADGTDAETVDVQVKKGSDSLSFDDVQALRADLLEEMLESGVSVAEATNRLADVFTLEPARWKVNGTKLRPMRENEVYRKIIERHEQRVPGRSTVVVT